MRLTEERRQESRRRKEEGTFCKLEICTLRLAKAKATEWKENGEGLTQTDANVEEEIVINEGKQLHEITDAIAPLLAADAHPHIPLSLTASPSPSPTVSGTSHSSCNPNRWFHLRWTATPSEAISAFS